MTIKSLTITEDAYDTLKRLKYEDESFSRAILRIGSQRKDIAERYFGILKSSDSKTIQRIESIKKRRVQTSKEFASRQGYFKKIREE